MPLPLIHLGYLAVRQASKPVASFFKQKAKTTPLLRTRVLTPIAQLYHRFDSWLKLLQHGIGVRGGGGAVKPLSEEASVNVAADILGELIIFGVAMSCVVIEYKRQQRNERIKQTMQNERLAQLETRASELVAAFTEGRDLLARVTSTNPSLLPPPAPLDQGVPRGAGGVVLEGVGKGESGVTVGVVGKGMGYLVEGGRGQGGDKQAVS